MGWLQSFFEFIPYLYSTITARDLIDVFFVGLVIYLFLVFVKQTRSLLVVNVFIGLVGITYLAGLLNLSLTRQLLQQFLAFVLVIFVIIFQRELRRFFDWLSLTGRRLAREQRRAITREVSAKIVDALEKMAEKRIGALLVLAGDYPLDGLTEGGFLLDGRISEELLLSIFDHNSPGHDGAVIIDNNRLRRFGVHLPLAENYSQHRKRGTRHRAAAGITEKSDALALVVSEERGEISVAEGGKLRVVTDTFELETAIARFLKENLSETRGWRYLITENLGIKFVAVALAAVLWTIFIFQAGTVTKDFDLPLEIKQLPARLVVSEMWPQTVRLTLSGSYRDFEQVSSNSISVSVALTNAEPGVRDVVLKDATISYPNYFKLIDVSPEKIRLIISDAPRQ